MEFSCDLLLSFSLHINLTYPTASCTSRLLHWLHRSLASSITAVCSMLSSLLLAGFLHGDDDLTGTHLIRAAPTSRSISEPI
uniref:Uncharacterized protein n=1 Tax=Arundo donax TaxID=35708 RepID=A0A0A9ARW5_ARUDO